MSYRHELTKAMTMLAQDERTVFLGQGIQYPGHGMFPTLVRVPAEKRIELPVMEDAQMGMSIGLALAGRIPIAIYPRFDFLLLAVNQLVNHLDKLHLLTNGRFGSHVIVRTAVGAKSPLNPGPQHSSDYTQAFRTMLHNVPVVGLEHTEGIVGAYRLALKSDRPVLLVEFAEKYDDE